MVSPFPGMDPYLEQPDVWHDFHQSFMPFVRAFLTPQVSPTYIVKIEEHIYIHEPSAEERHLVGHGDITVARRGNASPHAAGNQQLMEAPARIVLPSVFEEREDYIEIRDRQSRELITVIELLSPTNKKPGPDREQYLAKRAQLIKSKVHFVEIDFLRGGPRMPLEKATACDYYVVVSRTEDRPEAGFWPIGLRDPLPVIPIPLRPPHRDAQLDLRKILDQVYDGAGYRDYIYSTTPTPPLGEADAKWAQELLSD